VNDDSQPSNEKHACGGTEPRREKICGIIVYKWKASPVEECNR